MTIKQSQNRHYLIYIFIAYIINNIEFKRMNELERNNQ